MARRKAFVLFELMNAMVFPAQAAKARGFDIVALNINPLTTDGAFAVPDGLVDEVVPIASWADRGTLTALMKDLASRYEVIGTHSMFEACLPYQSHLRELAGLPTTDAETMFQLIDKAQVRTKLYNAGLSALRSTTLEGALTWDSWQFDRAAVLKPANGTGSALCFTVSSLDELREAAHQARTVDVVSPMMREYIHAHGGFVLEEKAEGELLSAESLVYRGEDGFVALSGRYVMAADPVVELGTQLGYLHPQLDKIAEVSKAVHACLGFHHGASHLEFMVTDDGTVELIDFNPRAAGFASQVGLSEAFGVDYAELIVDIGTDVRPDLAFAASKPRGVVEMVVMPPEGTTELRSIEFPSDAILPRPTKAIGEKLSGRADQLDHVGMFLIAGDTAVQAHARGLAARREVRVNGVPLGDSPRNRVAHSPHIGQDLPDVRIAGKQS